MAAGEAEGRRVVVVHNYYQQRGGEDVVFESEVAMLRDRGWQVTPFTTHNDAVDAVGPISLAARAVWNSRIHDELLAVLNEVRPEVVHVHNTLPILSPAVFYAAKKFGAAVVHTLHNYRLTCVNGLLFRDGRPCTECVGKSTQLAGIAHSCYRGSRAASAVVAITTGIHRAVGTWTNVVDRYIATTSFAAETFVAAGLPAERLVVKPHFLREIETPPAGQLRDGSGPALFVGRLSGEKGITVLLSALKHLGPHREIAIAGEGPMEAAVVAAAAERRNVRWLGQLNRADLALQLSRAGSVVVPSECYETFGRTVVEAFANGVPVIASDHGALQSLVHDGSNGFLFKPSDPAALAAAIERLAADRELNSRMGARARERFEQSFTEAANYELLTGIYAAAIDRRRWQAA